MNLVSQTLGFVFALINDMSPKLLTILLFFVPTMAVADCDCQKACQTVRYQEMADVGYCGEEDAQRCGAQLDFEMTSGIRNNPNSRNGKQLNDQAAQFLKALHTQRNSLQTIYSDQIRPEEYAQLAGLAYGILGTESAYYLSERYFIKSWTPNSVINVARCLIRGNCTNPAVSEGPTQIKQIPEPIVDYYGATPSSLYKNSTHAAAATMGFLIELKRDLYRLKAKYPEQMKEMNESNVTDYLAYFYQGKGVRIIQKGEKPSTDANPYFKKLKDLHLKELFVKQMSCPGVIETHKSALPRLGAQ